MSDEPAVVKEELSTAEELVGALNPLDPRWGEDPLAWVFRGQGDSAWKLRAKAHRLDGFDHLGVDFDASGADWSRLADAELEVLERFRDALDATGLPVPARMPEVTRGEVRYTGADPDPEAWPLRALAQHFRLPTALLDWTRRAPFAAYFAAASSVKEASCAPLLAVWALRLDFVESLRERSVDDLRFILHTAPSATNPNLRAQRGLFTQLSGVRGHLTCVESFVETALLAAKTWDLKPYHDAEGLNPNRVPRPVLRCLTLPREQAPKLLRFLAYEGATGATMYPGYDGVVLGMREEALWDTPPTRRRRR